MQISSKLKINLFGHFHGKLVGMFKNGVFIDKFESCSDLSRKSIERFGIILTQTGIARVCRHERKQYKGFTFEYI